VINSLKLNWASGGAGHIKDVEVESTLVCPGLIDQLDYDVSSVGSLAVDNVEGCDWCNGRHSCPLIADQRRAIHIPVNIGVRGSNVLNIDGEVVACLDVDILERRDDLGGKVTGSCLNGITWGSGLRLTNSVVCNNSKVVVFSICQLICTALVDVSDYLGLVPPGVCALHLHLDDVSLNCAATIIKGLVPSEINEGSVPVIGLRPSWSFGDISLIPSNEGFIQWSRIRLAN